VRLVNANAADFARFPKPRGSIFVRSRGFRFALGVMPSDGYLDTTIENTNDE
jgi:hypothetical protein